MFLETIFLFLVELFVFSFIGICQSLVGIFWPNENLRVRVMQRNCLMSLIASVCAFAAAILLSVYYPGVHVTVLGYVGLALILLCALLGNRVEKACRAH